MTVGGCKALLEVSEEDLFFTYRSSYDGDTETCVTFECPSCGVLTDVTVPGSVHDRIPKNRRQPSKSL